MPGQLHSNCQKPIRPHGCCARDLEPIRKPASLDSLIGEGASGRFLSDRSRPSPSCREGRRLAIESLECRRLLALNPTADEQELMQLVNRFRTDPQGEFSRLISVASPIQARDPVLQVDLDYAVVNGNTLRSELQALSPVPPVSWNEAVRDFTTSHNARLIQARSQFHSNTLERRQALLDAGVPLRFANGEKIHSENVYGYGKSPLHIFAAYVIDWQRGGPGGMASGRSHRAAMGNPHYEQAGHTITNFGGANFGPRVNTQVLANIENPPVMVTGAIFEDKNASGWYDAGEGLGSVQFVFQGVAGTFTTTGFATGGYQIELPPGRYTATATGGGMKYPQHMRDIIVGDTSVWKNWIYDPDVIPADAFEANDSRAAATPLSGGPQSFPSLSIHRSSDVDYFRLESPGSGSLQVDLQFSNAAGNLDLRLLDAAGSVLASAATAADRESLSFPVVRGSVVYVQVLGQSGAVNGSYALDVTPPQAAPPLAQSDRASSHTGGGSIVIDILANDIDPDGDSAQLTPKLAAGTPAAFTLSAQGTVNYVAPAGYSGVHRAQYTVTDDQGLESSPGQLAVFVVDYADSIPWQNAASAWDVNDDGATSPLDALLVVNEINQRRSRPLPTSPGGADAIFGFVDTSGDGFLSPLDALLVVNRLNGNGEGEFPANHQARVDEGEQAAATDAALAAWSAAHESWPSGTWDWDARRRKWPWE